MCLYSFSDRDKNTMICGYRIGFSNYDIDFPSIQTRASLTKRERYIRDRRFPNHFETWIFYMSISWLVARPTLQLEVALSRVPFTNPAKMRLHRVEFRNSSSSRRRILFSLEGNQTRDRYSFATYSGLEIDKIHFMFDDSDYASLVA